MKQNNQQKNKFVVEVKTIQDFLENCLEITSQKQAFGYPYMKTVCFDNNEYFITVNQFEKLKKSLQQIQINEMYWLVQELKDKEKKLEEEQTKIQQIDTSSSLKIKIKTITQEYLHEINEKNRQLESFQSQISDLDLKLKTQVDQHQNFVQQNQLIQQKLNQKFENCELDKKQLIKQIEDLKSLKEQISQEQEKQIKTNQILLEEKNKIINEKDIQLNQINEKFSQASNQMNEKEKQFKSSIQQKEEQINCFKQTEQQQNDRLTQISNQINEKEKQYNSSLQQKEEQILNFKKIQKQLNENLSSTSNKLCEKKRQYNSSLQEKEEQILHFKQNEKQLNDQLTQATNQMNEKDKQFESFSQQKEEQILQFKQAENQLYENLSNQSNLIKEKEKYFKDLLQQKEEQIQVIKQIEKQLNEKITQITDQMNLKEHQFQTSFQQKEQQIMNLKQHDKQLNDKLTNFSDLINEKEEQFKVSQQKKDKSISVLKQTEKQLNEELLKLTQQIELERESFEKKIKEEKEKGYFQSQNQYETIQSLKKDISQIQIEKQKLNQYVPQKDCSEYGYDMIIQVSSIYDLENIDQSQQNEIPGLKIQKFNKNFNSELKNIIVVGFQGLRNKGKTFLLNCLINEDFPSDYHVSTPGICIREHVISSKKIGYIDSEGLGNPVSIDYENNPNYQKFINIKRDNEDQIDEISKQNLDSDIKNRFYDIKATEQMQQDFIIQNSNILIIVISQLTQEDQKLIQQISEKFVVDNANKSQKKLIVVHNLQESRSQKYIEEYIKKLKKNFPVQEQLIDTYDQQKDEQHYSTVLYDEVKTHITHVVMGHRDSEAGNYYNKFALYYIKQKISFYEGLTNFNITEKLLRYLNQNLHNYVSFKKTIQTDEVKQNPNLMESILEYCPQAEKIVLKKGIKIEKIKELQVNIFGSLQKEYLYQIIQFEQSGKKEINLFIEIPGNVTVKKKYEKSKGLLQLQVTQNKENEINQGEVLASTRKFDEKQFTIPIRKDKELWEFKEVTSDKGVYKYVFIKEEEDQEYS